MNSGIFSLVEQYTRSHTCIRSYDNIFFEKKKEKINLFKIYDGTFMPEFGSEGLFRRIDIHLYIHSVLQTTTRIPPTKRILAKVG